MSIMFHPLNLILKSTIMQHQNQSIQKIQISIKYLILD